MSPDTNTDPNSSPESLADALAEDVCDAKQNSSAEELVKLADEVQQANDRALRATAELENFRRRMRREMEDERKYASLPLFSDLLPIVDNLGRALEAAEKTDAAASLAAGVKMVQTQLLAVFEKHQCRRIGEVGAAFDPDQHQAIAQQASAEIPANHVTIVAQHGYRLHDRVVRPASVMVSTGPA